MNRKNLQYQRSLTVGLYAVRECVVCVSGRYIGGYKIWVCLDCEISDSQGTLAV